MKEKMQNVAIIVGAGKGKRIGNKDKAFLQCNKKPILVYSILPFEKSKLINEIILVTRRSKINSAKKIINKFGFRKIRKIVAGGRIRQDSVYNALKKVDKADYILVHDVARPLISKQLIERCVKAAEKFGAAIPAVLSRDTIKIGNKFVERTPERSNLWLVQTPQVFKYNILKKAYDAARKDKFYRTDDASLVERLGYKIKIVPAYFENIKITVPTDLIVAEVLLKKVNIWK